MIMKLKQKCIEIRNTPSFRWAVTTLVAAILFKIADLSFGFWIALLAAVTVAAVYPIWVKRNRMALYHMARYDALAAIQTLSAVAGRERSWHDPEAIGEPNPVETEDRFDYVRKRALAIHKELTMRTRHLDRCFAEGTAPYPGADWTELKRIAKRMVQMVDSAEWACSKRLWGLNKGLLDPTWKPEFIIHDGKPEPEPPVEIRVIVPMAEFEHLRDRKTRPWKDADVVALDPQPASAS